MRYRALTFSIWESLTPRLRLPDQVKLNQFDTDIVSEVEWTDLDWNEFGGDDDTVTWLELIQPFNENISKGIVVDLQLIENAFYQPHISMSESLKELGLESKIYKSLVEWAGHLYLNKERESNPIIQRILTDLELDSNFTCEYNEKGFICISNNNPNIRYLLNRFNSL
jgi:hypothetical protein